MRNIKLTIQYDGTSFAGFELQPGKRTIRNEIEKALYKLFGQKIKINAASRTDAGVHALGQVVNFSLRNPIPLSNIPKALNSVLPEDIRVIKAEQKPKKFNARFDAQAKEYEYLISNGDILPPQFRNYVWQVKPKLDLWLMRKAAKLLIGKHDFSSFCAAGGDDKNLVRTLYRLDIRKRRMCLWNSKLLVISCKLIGNGFLYKMVRNIVGTLVEVGLGKTSLAELRKILHARDRRLAGKTAPAAGLCLTKVRY
ncbi:MAG: tRNA pseudouridine(38-40) synthase TruA [Candidatus Margulisiibacteriota bacterium]